MKFTYVLVGWEGTASDSRILKGTLSREDPLKIPEGQWKMMCVTPASVSDSSPNNKKIDPTETMISNRN